jgi:hypothetical protein
MPTREYFVIDGDGHVSFNVKDQSPDAYATLKAAQKRARDLAKSEPGHTVVIVQAIAYVTCEVGPPKMEMRERKLRS